MYIEYKGAPSIPLYMAYADTDCPENGAKTVEIRNDKIVSIRSS